MIENKLIKMALSAGADKAAVISRDLIITSEEFRRICKSNQCGRYGKCWMCPPEIGEIDALVQQVSRYDYGLLYQSISALEDSYDIEGMADAGRRHAMLSQRIQQMAPPLIKEPFLHLSCGGCNLCQACAKQSDQPCRFPDKALPPMEGYGIDVYNTTKSTNLKYINGPDTVTYFGIVLFSK